MNETEAPSCIVIAGPNGAGKSTAAPMLLRDFLGVQTFVNADTIARGLSEFDPASVALEAGRIMLDQLNSLAKNRKNFAFETTLSGRSYAAWLKWIRKEFDYRVTIFYLWLPTVEQSARRVRERVRSGGHDIPKDAIQRRHQRSIDNFLNLYSPLADAWSIFDNSRDDGPATVAYYFDEKTIVVDASAWRLFSGGRNHEP